MNVSNVIAIFVAASKLMTPHSSVHHPGGSTMLMESEPVVNSPEVVEVVMPHSTELVNNTERYVGESLDTKLVQRKDFFLTIFQLILPMWKE